MGGRFAGLAMIATELVVQSNGKGSKLDSILVPGAIWAQSLEWRKGKSFMPSMLALILMCPRL